MKHFLFAVLSLLMVFGVASAQSGRRIESKPTPTPTPAEDEGPQYSESQQSAPRRARPQLGFPKMGQDTGTKPQTTTQPGTDSSNDDVLRIETNLITIPVSVFDRNGLYIIGLEQHDFKIFENGKEQDIAYFGTTDKPFTVILLIDTSPSTAYKIEEIHQAAIAFVQNLEPQDSVTVIEFARSVHVLTESTNDREKIYDAIRKARFGDGTSLYDAVDFTLRKRLSKVEGRKAIVLFTDGVDTTSRGRYEKTVDEAEEADSLIFPIYFNTFMQRFEDGGMPIPVSGGNMGRGDSSEEYMLGRRYLEDLAAVTGGRVFRPESSPGGLTVAFEGIAEELRRQYSIGYIPKDEGTPGQRKDIKVRVSRQNVVVRARDSYIVGSKVAQTKPDSPKPND